MVDDQFHGDQGIDLVRVTAQSDDGVAHRGQVNDGRYSGEVLHEDALGREGDLLGVFARGLTVV